jgi:hypothetical protein
MRAAELTDRAQATVRCGEDVASQQRSNLSRVFIQPRSEQRVGRGSVRSLVAGVVTQHCH